MLETMLESDAPEEQKIDIRLNLALSHITGAVRKYAKPTPDDDKAKALYPARLELFNIMKKCEEDINAFMTTHPLPAADTQD